MSVTLSKSYLIRWKISNGREIDVTSRGTSSDEILQGRECSVVRHFIGAERKRVCRRRLRAGRTSSLVDIKAEMQRRHRRRKGGGWG